MLRGSKKFFCLQWSKAFSKFFGGCLVNAKRFNAQAGDRVAADGGGGSRERHLIPDARKSMCARPTHGQRVLCGAARTMVRSERGVRRQPVAEFARAWQFVGVPGQHVRRAAVRPCLQKERQPAADARRENRLQAPRAAHDRHLIRHIYWTVVYNYDIKYKDFINVVIGFTG